VPKWKATPKGIQMCSTHRPSKWGEGCIGFRILVCCPAPPPWASPLGHMTALTHPFLPRAPQPAIPPQFTKPITRSPFQSNYLCVKKHTSYERNSTTTPSKPLSLGLTANSANRKKGRSTSEAEAEEKNDYHKKTTSPEAPEGERLVGCKSSPTKEGGQLPGEVGGSKLSFCMQSPRSLVPPPPRGVQGWGECFPTYKFGKRNFGRVDIWSFR